MNYLTTLLLMLCMTALQAQSKYFEKTIQFNDIQDFRQVLSIGNDFVASGNSINESDMLWHCHTMRFDQYGQEMWLKTYESNISQYGTNNIVKTADGYAFSGWVYENSDDQDGFLMRINEVGDSVQFKRLEMGNDISSFNSLLLHNNTFVMTGNVVFSNTEKGHIVAIDALNNDTIWTHLYHQYDHSNIRDIVAAPDNSGYYCAGNINMDFTGAVDQSDILLAKIHSNGTILWDTTYNPSGNDQTIEMATTPDNYILIAGGRTPDFDEQTRVGLLYKIDTMGNIIWENNLLYAGYQSIRVLADGNYGIGGVIWHSLEAPYNLDAVIVKINAQTGETMWYRSYGSPTYHDYAYDFTPTPDGGFMAVGRSDSTNYAYAYLLKLNCMGLLTEPAAAFSTYQTGNSPLEVAFVNASQYVYPDSIDGGHYVWDFGDGSPPFVCGQGFGACPDVVLHSYAAQGQYTASLRAVVCSDTSQVAQSVVVLWNGIAIVDSSTWVSVQPNPAQNTAFVPYHIAADKTANLCLYDLYGKLVYTTTLQNSGVAELPTAQQATGIYVLQVTMNGSSIAQQKIVLLH
jgi:hypothetical protein